MNKFYRPPVSVLSSLSIDDNLTVEDVMNTVEVGQFGVMHLMEAGLESLKNVLIDPGKLKIDITGTPVTVFEDETYYIGGASNGRISSPTPWYLNNEEDFEKLKAYLTQGLYLFSKIPEGYAVIASKENIPDMVVSRDKKTYWHDLVAEYFNEVIQTLTPWKTKPRLRIYSRFIDVDSSFVVDEETVINNETFLRETLDALLDDIINQVISFVRKDVMALTIATGNNRGVQVARYGNAIALKYAIDAEYKRLIEKQNQSE